MDHVVIEKISKCSWFLISHESSSLKSMKLVVRQQFHKVRSTHTTSNSLHDHKAWRVDSFTHLQQSQNGSSMTIRHTKFSLVGNKLQQALRIRFFIFFSTCKDQIPHHSSLSCLNYSPSFSSASSDFKNLYPDLLIYDPI